FEVRAGIARGVIRGLALALKWPVESHSVPERPEKYPRGRLHTVERLNSLEHLVLRGARGLNRVTARRAELNFGGDDACGLEAEILMLQIHERAADEQRADRDDEGERDLACDERVRNSATAWPAT